MRISRNRFLAKFAAHTLRGIALCALLLSTNPLPAEAQEPEEHEAHDESVLHLDPDMAARMGVRSVAAGPGVIHQTESLFGKISPDPRQVSHITARYPGLIQSVRPALGDHVEQGDLIATVEANDSLQTYEIRAPISGVVVDSHANPGEFAGQDHLLTIADYTSVWADLNVFPGMAQRIRPGQPVTIHMEDLTAVSTIRYLNPGEGRMPSIIARVPVANPELLWTPGLLVEGEVTLDRFEVQLAIDNRALQDHEGQRIVFIQEGDEYEVRPLVLGRGDALNTEVLAGLSSGERYVVDNSYLLKAELEKSAAEHNH